MVIFFMRMHLSSYERQCRIPVQYHSYSYTKQVLSRILKIMWYSEIIMMMIRKGLLQPDVEHPIIIAADAVDGLRRRRYRRV